MFSNIGRSVRKHAVLTLPLAGMLHACFFCDEKDGIIAHASAPNPLPDLDIHQLVSSTQIHVKSKLSVHKEGFYVLYDTRSKNPICVVEKLSSSSKLLEDSKGEGDDIEQQSKKGGHKRPNFYAESTISSDLFKVNVSPSMQC